ncbi:flagellar hook-basal body family protein [Anoxybacillus sp. B7M1]|jgi:flagellar basal-body rod protein FlgG|uniref:flagellar hook-basal body protein n=1 Tax=unclassified Anoxybacillus TaxID=2639704 RepID=UPI0005CCEA3E|nr:MULTISPECIES: flagellar hook-basal body protein [unclassified Anoxybacillus]ANB58600.1 flagellar hook-basal body family protein [Anoxybacillus sp. B2M1]ANB62836.1 flagellar hook-basal body family protein [Anoxybacillus sp. B7M1]
MLRSMITAANTMNQLQQQLDVISHNITNSNTPGFKRRETNFSELLVQQFTNLPNDQANRLTPAGVRRGVGAKLGETNLVLKQGALMQTGRPLDVAFAKEGQFFRVLINHQDGTSTIGYTRDGAFYLSPSEADSNELMLVTSDGYPVLDRNNEPILVRDDFQKITITNTGTIQVTDANGNVSQTVELGVTNILRPQLLQSIGDNLLAFPDLAQLGVGEADVAQDMIGNMRSQIHLQQGALEQSNVDLGTEMTDLMLTQRSYQMNAKSISISDQMLGLINGVRS